MSAPPPPSAAPGSAPAGPQGARGRASGGAAPSPSPASPPPPAARAEARHVEPPRAEFRAAFRMALGALLSHWRRRPGQLLSLIVGLMAAAALWSGVQALNAEARASYARAASAFAGVELPALAAADGGAIPQSAFAALRRAGHDVSPMIEGRIRIGAERYRLIGLDPVSLPQSALPPALRSEGAEGAAPPDPAAFLRPPWRLLAAPETAARLGLAQGETGADAQGRPLPPLMVSARMAPGLLLTDIGAAQRILGREGELDRLLLADPAAAAPPPLPGVPALLRRAAPDRPDLEALTASFHLNLTAFGMLSFLVGLFIAHAAAGLAFEQRRPTMRTLRALGVSARMLAAALAAEMLGIALIAGALGLGAGYLVAGALLPDVAATLRGLYGAATPGALSLSPFWALSGLAMTLLGAGAAAGTGILKAARMPPLAAARPEAWREAQARGLRRQRAGAGAILLAGGGAALLLPGMLSGFALMAAMMLGGALLLPSALALALEAGAARARRPLALWLWSDARQQLSGLSLALMALLLALSASIGVGGMVQSFRDTFHHWLDGRLLAEVYTRIEDAPTRARLAEFAAGDGRVIALLPDPAVEVTLLGLPTEIHGLSAHPRLRAAWPLLEEEPGAWDALAAGEAALISEQLARRAGLATGDALALSGPAAQADLRVAGIYADYGNPRAQLRIAPELLLRLYPEADAARTAILTDAPRAPLIADLKAALGPGAAVLDQRAVKAESRAIFERTFAVTAALDALTLGVAGAALLTALATLAEARLPLLAPVWAMGARRATLAGLELLRTALLALLTAALAIPLGVALTWALNAVVNPAAFGWALPVGLYPADWLRLAGLAALAAGLAAAPGAWRLSRMAPARLLARFAGER